MSHKSGGNRSRYGIKWKMYAILIAFIGIGVGMIYFFQLKMLSYFYQSNKFFELENTALVITQELNDPNFKWSLIEDHSDEYDEDIWVYRTDGVNTLTVTAGYT